APDEREMGRITSSARSPQLQRTVALAYIRYAYLEPGTRARVVLSERELEARVQSLPLVRGSWFTENAT
ncbi:glycine cleavage T C-terminal barrel domain-containing protein, partial [Acinetobacter baumannii]